MRTLYTIAAIRGVVILCVTRRDYTRTRIMFQRFVLYIYIMLQCTTRGFFLYIFFFLLILALRFNIIECITGARSRCTAAVQRQYNNMIYL